ncbi:hypothetical protein D3C78_1632760 [compost metagenome]
MPAVPVSLAPPVRMAVTLMASPSRSTSLSSTLPVGLTPGCALFSPPASMATPWSVLGVGVSLRPRMMICSSAWSFRLPRSVTW